MKASDLFLKCLEAEGVDTIYGVPGEENADLMISLLDSSIDFIICQHEQNASFMAAMYGHLTGKPGVCLSTLGPGATNLMTGVASANMDHAPLVAILGQASTHRLHKESHQNMDAISMYKPVCKWASSIRDASVIPESIAKAFKLARSNKPGATVLELPEDIAKEEVFAQPILQSQTAQPEENADPKQLTRALNLIAASKAPLLLAGAGCTREACDAPIATFLEKSKIFGASTFMGKGAISAKKPYCLYCVGLGMKDIALQAFETADLIICAGYDLVEWPPDHWNSGQRKKIIHIDTLPAEVDSHYIPDIELIGTIGSIFEALNERLTTEHQKNVRQFGSIRKVLTHELSQHHNDQSFPIKPQRILSDLRESLNADDILISDVGAHKMWIARQYPTYQSKTCFISNGFCSMAGSMASAFTAKRLLPNKRVVALCGDGGFIMGMTTIPTAVRYHIPIVVIVWQDDYYGLIKWKQEATYHKFSSVDLKNPDLVAVSQALGCHAVRLESADQLIPQLQIAFQEDDKPSVIVVPIDYSENMKLTERLGKILSR